MRACSRCKVEKSDDDFYDYKYQCKVCHQSYQQDKDKRKEWSARYYSKRKATDPQLFMWKQAKHRAQWDYNNMEFTIEVSDVIIPNVCPYLGVPFEPLNKKYGYSLDRIDSTKGYIPGNIQVICRLANMMKTNATEKELIAFAEGVLRRHPKEG